MSNFLPILFGYFLPWRLDVSPLSARLAFEEVGLNYQEYGKIDERFYRPAEVNEIDDACKAQSELA